MPEVQLRFLGEVFRQERRERRARLSFFEIRFELRLERFAGAVDERFGGGHGAAEDFGNFLVRKLLESQEDDGGALFFGQRLNGGADFLFEFALQCFGGGIRRVRVGDGLARHFSCAVLNGVERLGLVTVAASDFVEGGVADDGVEPRRELGGRFIAVRGLIDLNENSLREVFRFPTVADGAVDDVDDGRLVPFDKRAEGVLVTAPNGYHQFHVALVAWHYRFDPIKAARAIQSPTRRSGRRGR
jgi:hypothetical protein